MADLAGCAKRLKIGNPDAPPLVCLVDVVTTLISLAFMFLGAVSILFLLYGAIKFITSGGDPKAVKSARDTMTYALIGTVLVALVFVIANIFADLIVPGGGANIFDFKLPP